MIMQPKKHGISPSLVMKTNKLYLFFLSFIIIIIIFYLLQYSFLKADLIF